MSLSISSSVPFDLSYSAVAVLAAKKSLALLERILDTSCVASKTANSSGIHSSYDRPVAGKNTENNVFSFMTLPLSQQNYRKMPAYHMLPDFLYGSAQSVQRLMRTV